MLVKRKLVNVPFAVNLTIFRAIVSGLAHHERGAIGELVINVKPLLNETINRFRLNRRFLILIFHELSLSPSQMIVKLFLVKLATSFLVARLSLAIDALHYRDSARKYIAHQLVSVY